MLSLHNKCPITDVYAQMIKKKNFKLYFVVINLNNFEVKITSRVTVASQIMRCSRNTIPKPPARAIINNFLFIPILEE